MNQQEIIKLIKTQKTWESDSLIKAIKEQAKKSINVKLCYIGGYELMKDGTKTKLCKSLEDIQDILEDFEIDYDNTITDPIALAMSVQQEWAESWNDGGGRGWIEFNQD